MKKKITQYHAPIGTYYVEAVKQAIEVAKDKNETINFTFNGHDYLISPISRTIDVVALIDAARFACVKNICGE